jgi:hypothetical protein
MAPLTHTDTFDVSLTPAEVRERVLTWFRPYSHRVVVDTLDRLEVISGSQAKMRIIGGAFIAASSLPTRTAVTIDAVTIDAGAAGSKVGVTARDAVGFGLKTGMKHKYEQWVASIVDGIRAALT